MKIKRYLRVLSNGEYYPSGTSPYLFEYASNAREPNGGGTFKTVEVEVEIPDIPKPKPHLEYEFTAYVETYNDGASMFTVQSVGSGVRYPMLHTASWDVSPSVRRKVRVHIVTVDDNGEE